MVSFCCFCSLLAWLLWVICGYRRGASNGRTAVQRDLQRYLYGRAFLWHCCCIFFWPCFAISWAVASTLPPISSSFFWIQSWLQLPTIFVLTHCRRGMTTVLCTGNKATWSPIWLSLFRSHGYTSDMHPLGPYSKVAQLFCKEKTPRSVSYYVQKPDVYYLWVFLVKWTSHGNARTHITHCTLYYGMIVDTRCG